MALFMTLYEFESLSAFILYTLRDVRGVCPRHGAHGMQNYTGACIDDMRKI